MIRGKMMSKWLNWVMAWAGIALVFAMVIWYAAKTLGCIVPRGTRQPIFYGYQPKKTYGNGKLPKSR